MPESTYKCPECGLHYEDEAVASDCEEFCRVNKACSVEITSKSIEAQQHIKQQ